MANRVKEDDKNERIIRNLLKLPENRRCINCNSLGPQYVCTNFSTFICTTCSGIHREFTHRVKSVSMAKFTPLEVSALQGGGNASAREIYLKEWDTQRNSLPDGSNIERLRDFIKHVYVDRRFTGERSAEKPPRGEAEDYGNRKTETYQGGSGSPPYDDRTERRYGDKPGTGGRSPGYDPENRKNIDHRRTSLIEIVNDWRREDRIANGRKPEDRSSDGGTKLEGTSPDCQQDPELASPPEVRPVRDILGDSVAPLHVIEPPNFISRKSTGDAVRTQRTASSSSLASSDTNPSEIKVIASFIDFDSFPDPPKSGTSPQVQQSAADVSSVQPTATSSNNWANFDSIHVVKAQPTVSNSVESILSEFPVPMPAAQSVIQSTGAPAFVSSAPQLANVQLSYLTNPAPAGNFPAFGPQNSGFPGGFGRSLSQGVAPVPGPFSSHQGWNSLPQNVQVPSVFPVNQRETSTAAGNSFGLIKEQSLQPKLSGRKALPEDLFTMNYHYSPSPASIWYPGSVYAAGLPPQYNMPSSSWQPVPNQPAASRSMNPFEVGHEQPLMFPSLASLQGALPRTAAPGLQRTSSLEPNPGPPVYAPSAHQNAFRGQEMGRSISARPQDITGFGLDAPGFTSLHPSHSAPSNFTSTGGNPFG